MYVHIYVPIAAEQTDVRSSRKRELRAKFPLGFPRSVSRQPGSGIWLKYIHQHWHANEQRLLPSCHYNCYSVLLPVKRAIRWHYTLDYLKGVRDIRGG